MSFWKAFSQWPHSFQRGVVIAATTATGFAPDANSLTPCWPLSFAASAQAKELFVFWAPFLRIATVAPPLESYLIYVLLIGMAVLLALIDQ